MERQRKWNGWGYEGEELGPERIARWMAGAGLWLGVRPEDRRMPVALESLALPAPRVDLAVAGLSGRIERSPYERALHAAGRSYGDLIRLRTGQGLRFPDGVAYPETEDDLGRLMEHAAIHQIALIPYGGGSSVVGGVEPAGTAGQAGVISVDLSRLNRVREVDVHARRVRVEAGMLGPDLEAALRPHGLAFRHYPQSHQHSTVGGWVAARAGGHFATRHGKIDSRVESLRVITPAGAVQSREVPASASGPSGNGLFVGSEGSLGFITEAVLRALLPPVRKLSTGFRYPDFAAGLDALRRVVQAGLQPPVLRLLDEYEAMVAALTQGQPYQPGALLLVGFEVDDESAATRVEAEWQEALRLCRAAGGEEAGDPAVRAWKSTYFEQPYWRDLLIDYGVLVDTVETAVVWSQAMRLYEGGRRALLERLPRWSESGGVLCRVTHVYPDGCSLYFTFFARPEREGLFEAWRDLQRTALETFLAHGATLSHHHGTGQDFQPLFEREHGSVHLEALRGLKGRLDPHGVLNPRLFFGGG